MEETGTDDGADVMFHGKFAVQVDPEIANHIDWLDDVQCQFWIYNVMGQRGMKKNQEVVSEQ